MLKRKTVLVLMMAAFSVANGAFAGDKAGDKAGKPGEHGAASVINWDEFKARCENPERFDVQRAPQNIKVQCTDVSNEFVASDAGRIPLAGMRTVAVTVLSDKFHVATAAREVAIAGKSGSCLRFKEVQKTLTVEKPLSCGEVLAMKGDVGDFCVAALDSVKAGNAKLIEVQDTGRVVDTCGNLAAGDGKSGK